MPPRAGRRRTGTVIPVLLSLGLHVPLVLLFWFFPRTERAGAGGHSSPGIFLDLEDPRQARLHRASRPANDETIDLQKVVLDEPPAVTPMPPVPAAPSVAVAVGPGGAPTAAPPAPSAPSAPTLPSGQAGAGSGAGQGGARSRLFPVPATARKVVYVVDCSASMGVSGALIAACRELLASLRRLPAGARFQVIAYNSQAEPLRINGSTDLLSADAQTVAAVAAALERLEAAGSTEHNQALLRGLSFRPDVLYFVTDADDVPLNVLSATRFSQGQTTIHTIELRRRLRPPAESPLRLLAESNGGSYRCVAP
jgi:hypothetical protein